MDNGDLVLKSPRPLPDDLLAEIKDHKPELLPALTQPFDLDTLLARACQGMLRASKLDEKKRSHSGFGGITNRASRGAANMRAQAST